jgi:hypothetical protein
MFTGFKRSDSFAQIQSRALANPREGLLLLGPMGIASAIAFLGVVIIVAGAVLHRRREDGKPPLPEATQRALGLGMLMASLPLGLVARAWRDSFQQESVSTGDIQALLEHPGATFLVYGPLAAAALTGTCGAAYLAQMLWTVLSRRTQTPPPQR